MHKDHRHFPVTFLKLDQLCCHFTRINTHCPLRLGNIWLSLVFVFTMQNILLWSVSLSSRSCLAWTFVLCWPCSPYGESILRSLGWTACLWVLFHDNFLQITLKTTVFSTVAGSQLKRCCDHFVSFRNKSWRRAWDSFAWLWEFELVKWARF